MYGYQISQNMQNRVFANAPKCVKPCVKVLLPGILTGSQEDKQLSPPHGEATG